MTEVTLEARMERLERENRRLKLWVLVVLAVVGGLVCIAATEPVAKVVRAQRFEVVDAKGKTRASLSALPEGTGFSLNDEKGQVRALLSVSSDGRPVLVLADEKGKTRAELSVRPDGSPGLVLADEKGKTRAVIGTTDLERTQTGATERTAESSAVLFDRDGKVMWKAP